MIKLYFEDNCPYCGEFISERCEDYVVDTSYYDREMGTETEYTIECDEYTCPNCEKKFSFYGSIWEYPEGTLNLNDIVIEPIDSIE